MVQAARNTFSIGNVVCKCHEIQRSGKPIGSAPLAVLLSTSHRIELFDRLASYTKQYHELQQFLRTHYSAHQGVASRVAMLPSIRFRSFGIGSIGIGLGGWLLLYPVLYTLLLVVTLGPAVFFTPEGGFALQSILLWPLPLVYIILLLCYVRQTKRKIHRINRLMGSIAFILQAEQHDGEVVAA